MTLQEQQRHIPVGRFATLYISIQTSGEASMLSRSDGGSIRRAVMTHACIKHRSVLVSPMLDPRLIPPAANRPATAIVAGDLRPLDDVASR